MMINKMAVSLALVFVFFFFTACAKIKYHTTVIEGPKQITEKNYEINQPRTVSAGGKMMEVKDFWGALIKRPKMKALNNFTIDGPHVKHSGFKGDMYNVILTADVNLQLRHFIEIPDVFYRYGVSPDGQWLNLYFFDGQILNAKTPIKPKDTKFEYVEAVSVDQVDSSKPFTWFEIIFTGKTQDAINLLYREYALDSVEQPAFQQRLPYSTSTKKVYYKQLIIEIHDVTPESISYTVLDDGMPGTPVPTPGVKP